MTDFSILEQLTDAEVKHFLRDTLFRTANIRQLTEFTRSLVEVIHRYEDVSLMEPNSSDDFLVQIMAIRILLKVQETKVLMAAATENDHAETSTRIAKRMLRAMEDLVEDCHALL